VDYTDGVLRIHTHPTNNHYFGPTGSLNVTIALPTGSSVQAKTASSELRDTGRLGDVTFEGAYRHIKIDEAASVHLTAIDGDIEIGRLEGPAQISTTRGDIRITKAVHGTVVLTTQSGEISTSTRPPPMATSSPTASERHQPTNSAASNSLSPSQSGPPIPSGDPDLPRPAGPAPSQAPGLVEAVLPSG
jgi:hypothetical protein